MAEEIGNKEATDRPIADELNKSANGFSCAGGVFHSVLTRKRKLELQGKKKSSFLNKFFFNF